MITIFSSPTCAYCHMAMQYFDSKGIKYKDVDVSQDMAAAQWVSKNTGMLATPVIDIDGTIIVGFDRTRIDAALRDKKLTP